MPCRVHVLLSLLLSVLVLGPARATPPDAPEIERVAVLDLRSTALDAERIRGLSGLVASELAQVPVFQVTTQSEVRDLLGFEAHRQLLGCSDASCLADFGGTLGARWLVTGEVSQVGQNFLVTLAMIDLTTGTAVQRVTRRSYAEDGLVDTTIHAVEALILAVRPEAAPTRLRLPGIQLAVSPVRSRSGLYDAARTLDAELLEAVSEEKRFVAVSQAELERHERGLGIDAETADIDQLCALGASAGAGHIIVSNLSVLDIHRQYRSESSVDENGRTTTRRVLDHAEAVLRMDVRVLTTRDCTEVRAEHVVTAGTHASNAALAEQKARNQAVARIKSVLRRALPIEATFVAVDGATGAIPIGSLAGVEDSIYFEVLRKDARVGLVFVNDVGPHESRVALVSGVPTLKKSDRLRQTFDYPKAEAVFLLGYVPVSLDGVRTTGLGSRLLLHGHPPAGGAIGGIFAENVFLSTSIVGWRVGFDTGYAVRIIPRWLQAYARIGLAYGWFNQAVDTSISFSQRVTTSSIHVDNGVGLKTVLLGWVRLTLEGSWPITLGYRNWRTTDDRNLPVDPNLLEVGLLKPTGPVIRLGVGFRF